MCREYKIHQLNFETIAYEDMSEREVLLSEKYLSYLRDDVVIIGRTRMAILQTACNANYSNVSSDFVMIDSLNEVADKLLTRR